MDDTHESGIDLPATIGRQGTISSRDVVKQKNKVDNDGNQKLDD